MAQPKMTLHQARDEFAAEVVPYLIRQYDAAPSATTLRCAWLDYLRELEKGGRITYAQGDSFGCAGPRRVPRELVAAILHGESDD